MTTPIMVDTKIGRMIAHDHEYTLYPNDLYPWARTQLEAAPTLLEALEGLFAAFQGNQSFSTAQWTAWERASRALALARSETTKEAPRG